MKEVILKLIYGSTKNKHLNGTLVNSQEYGLGMALLVYTDKNVQVNFKNHGVKVVPKDLITTVSPILVSKELKHVAKGTFLFEPETNEIFQCSENHLDQDFVIDMEGKKHVHGHDPFCIHRIEAMPENFRPEQIRAIFEGVIKDGEKLDMDFRQGGFLVIAPKPAQSKINLQEVAGKMLENKQSIQETDKPIHGGFVIPEGLRYKADKPFSPASQYQGYEEKSEAWKAWEEDQKKNHRVVNPYAFIAGFNAGVEKSKEEPKTETVLPEGLTEEVRKENLKLPPDFDKLRFSFLFGVYDKPILECDRDELLFIISELVHREKTLNQQFNSYRSFMDKANGAGK